MVLIQSGTSSPHTFIVMLTITRQKKVFGEARNFDFQIDGWPFQIVPPRYSYRTQSSGGVWRNNQARGAKESTNETML